ncbi:MAG: hypothetical protein ACLUI3_03055 [Christensenellales bacterium]
MTGDGGGWAGHPLPVDSERSAIFQCLQGAQGNTDPPDSGERRAVPHVEEEDIWRAAEQRSNTRAGHGPQDHH